MKLRPASEFTPLPVEQLPQRLRDKLPPPYSKTPEFKHRQELILDAVAACLNRLDQAESKYQAEYGAPINDCPQIDAEGGTAVHAHPGEAARAGGQHPPITNRGGKSTGSASPLAGLPSFEALEDLHIVPFGKNSKYTLVAIPKPDSSADFNHSFVDWVTFSFKSFELSLELNDGRPALHPHDYVSALSLHLYNIFGYGVSRKRESGLNFYQHSYDMGDNGWGFVCIGGQQESVCVTIKGQGLLAAKPGWEKRLYDFLLGIDGAKLTRIDLAHDNFASATSLDDYLQMYMDGKFISRGRAPNVEQAGNWINPNGKGRTLYIGSRTSGKLLRIYEKGLQLAGGFHEKYPHWVRVELELKNIDRVIPLDALLKPGQYLAGAYPALSALFVIQSIIATAKNTVKSTFERAVEVTRHQFGKHIYTIFDVLGSDEALRRLTQGKEELPRNLVFENYDSCPESDFLHTQPVKLVTLDQLPI